MNHPLRVGVLGTARICRHLIPALRTSRRTALTAVASRDAGRAVEFARTWAIPAAHTSYDALLRDTGVDAVYIPLPNALHVEWTLRALDAGKHVLCEKPLALTPDDVDRVAAVAQARGRVVAEAFMYRHEPMAARLAALVADGAIGTPQSMSSGFTFVLDRPGDVRHDATLGGGALWDIGCYPVDVTRLLLGGTPSAVFGWAATTTTGVDAAFTGLLRFDRDLVATVHCSFRAPYRTWLELTGSDGLIRVTSPFRPSAREVIEVVRDGRPEQIVVDGSQDLYLRQVDDFAAAALDGRPPVVSLASSRGNAAVLAALHASARLGQPVQL